MGQGQKLVMAHRTPGAPLVIWPIMAHLYLVRHYYIVVAHHILGAPLMSILAIAVFLVVLAEGSMDYSCARAFRDF